MASAPFRTDPRLMREEDITALRELEQFRLARGLPGIGQEVRELIGKLTSPEEPKPAIVAPLGAVVFDLDAPPFCPNGWKVESHKPGGSFAWDPTKVRLHLESEQVGEGSIKGTELPKRPAIASSAFNANLLDGLLGHPELIPDSWNGKSVYFWGTVYRDSDGRLCVRFLYWNGDRWRWHYDWLEDGWRLQNPSAVRASI